MQIKTVALVGANGTIGKPILEALLAEKSFNVTVLARASSDSKYPDEVTVKKMADEPTIVELEELFKGQDAVIIASAGGDTGAQARFANAASRANVKRFIPADYGSCDVYDDVTLQRLPSYRSKRAAHQYLVDDFSADDGGMTWTNFTCGHFLDFSIKTDFLKIDLEKRTATVFDDGNAKWSTTALPTVATAVVRVLQKLEETKNKMLYIQSFLISQNELVKALEKAMGTEWKVEHKSSKEFMEETEKKQKEDPEDTEAEFSMVAVVGVLHGNWEGKKDFANKILDLPNEDLDQVVKRIVDSA